MRQVIEVCPTCHGLAAMRDCPRPVDPFQAAVDREFPMPDNPHASVIQRAVENRAAMWRGIEAARKILAPESAAYPPRSPALERQAAMQAAAPSKCAMDGCAAPANGGVVDLCPQHRDEFNAWRRAEHSTEEKPCKDK